FIIRAINLNNLINYSDLYKEMLNSADIICLITNSAATNLGRTQRLFSLLKNKVNKHFFMLANFQDKEAIAIDSKQIEEMFGLKTFSFSAVEDASKGKILKIIKKMLTISIIDNIDG
ncbi:MAG: hypothetical protein ACFFAK_08935, partial [Promethearchaeota archaeon]